MISLYRPGASLLHRAPAWLKLVTLAVLALAISLTGTWWLGIAAGCVIVAACYLISGLGLGELARQVVLVRWVVLVMAASQLAFLPLEHAITGTVRVTLVIVLAALLTLTTRTSDLLDALESAIAPLRRVGVPSAQISLLIALTITTIPVLAALGGQLRDAQIARTGRVQIRAFVVPLLVLSLKHADAVADALRARGLD